MSTSLWLSSVTTKREYTFPYDTFPDVLVCQTARQVYTYSYQPVTYTYTCCSVCLRSPAVYSCIILLYGVSVAICIPSLFEHILLGSDDFKISTHTDVNTYYTSYIGRRKQLYVYNIIIQICMCPVVRGQLILTITSYYSSRSYRYCSRCSFRPMAPSCRLQSAPIYYNNILLKYITIKFEIILP